MSKTDKELTAEIVISYITSWNAKTTTNALKADDVVSLIESIHTTLQKLPVKED